MAKTNRSRARCVGSIKPWLTARKMTVLRAVADRDTVQNIAKSTAYRALPAIVNRAVLHGHQVRYTGLVLPVRGGLQGVLLVLGHQVPALRFNRVSGVCASVRKGMPWRSRAWHTACSMSCVDLCRCVSN
jgi:hypothetical protein